MTRDELLVAIDHCHKQIAFWGEEAEAARDEMYEAESQLEDEENTLDELQKELEEIDEDEQ